MKEKDQKPGRDEKEYIAHVREDGEKQTIEEHLQGTADLAAKFAKAFGAADLAAYVSRAHDIGKYSDDSQDRILNNGFRCDHSTAGALECRKRGALWAACCVLGHHRGLLDVGSPYDKESVDSVYGKLCKERAHKIPDYRKNWGGTLPEPPKLPEWCRTNLDMSYFIRMLYSCLVDADFLDTERFMLGDTGRSSCDKLPVLEQKLLSYEVKEKWNKPKGDLNHKRSEILRTCRDAGMLPRGLYTLTVPTGGGENGGVPCVCSAPCYRK